MTSSYVALWVLAGFAAACATIRANQATQAGRGARQGERKAGAVETEPKPAPEVQSAIRAAYAAPPEFAADALITLVEGGFVPGPQQKLRMLEDAFRLAADAPEKMQLDWWGGGAIVTGGVRVNAKGMDSPSLQARAATAMLALDPWRGRRQFQLIRLPETRFSCEDAFSWNPVSYYRAMSKVLASLSGAEQRDFVEAHLVHFRSAGQVRPLAMLLDRLLATQGAAAEPLVLDFAGHLPGLEMDAREFTATFELTSPTLASLAGEAPEHVREALVRKTREWVVRASNYGVCAQKPYRVMLADGSIRQVAPLHPADRYNKEIAALGGPADEIDLSKDVRVPLDPVAAKTAHYSEDYSRFDVERRLLAKDDDEGKLSPRWRTEMENHIAAIAGWTDRKLGELDATEFYLEKAELFEYILDIRSPSWRAGMTSADLVKLAKEGRQKEITGRERVILELAAWLEGQVARKVYDKRRIFWFQGVWYGVQRDPLLGDLLAVSRHPVLHLYGALAQLKRRADADAARR